MDHTDASLLARLQEIIAPCKLRPELQKDVRLHGEPVPLELGLYLLTQVQVDAIADALRRSGEALRESQRDAERHLERANEEIAKRERAEIAYTQERDKRLRLIDEVEALRARAALPDTTEEAAHGRSPHVEIIVNGQPVQVAAGPIRDAIADAIRQSGQIGAPIDQWVLRTRDGEIIPHELPDGREHALVGGQRFFLHLGLPKAEPADSHSHQASSRRPAAGVHDVSSAGSPEHLAMVQRAEAAEAEVGRSGEALRRLQEANDQLKGITRPSAAEIPRPERAHSVSPEQDDLETDVLTIRVFREDDGRFAAEYRRDEAREGGIGRYSGTPIGALAELIATLIKVDEDNAMERVTLHRRSNDDDAATENR